MLRGGRRWRSSKTNRMQRGAAAGSIWLSAAAAAAAAAERLQ